jgi:predicted transcriptional regulator
MAQSIVEMAKDLVMAQIEAGRLTPEDMHSALQQTYRSLMELKAWEETGAVGALPGDGAGKAPADWKKSIRRNAVTCLECGAEFKQLSVRHLAQHGLDARSYREKYGIPRIQSLAAKATTAARQRIVQQIKPWEKSPRFIEAREREEAEQKQAEEVEAKPATAPKKARPRQRKATARTRS